MTVSERQALPLRSGAAQADELPVERGIIRQAAMWAARIQAGAGQQDQESCCRWRAADPRHEIAWQRVTGLGMMLQDNLRAAGAPHVREVLGRAQHKAARRGLLRGVAGGLALAGIWYGAGPARQASAVWLADAGSGPGERRVLELDDGTLLYLNTRSAVDVQYSASVRSVTLLQGEILIETAVDQQGRPFLLHTASGILQPVGTRFVVRERSGQRYDLTVMEGAVDWRPLQSEAGAAVRVRAGESLSFGQQGPVSPVGAASRNAAAWEHGMLVADNLPLGHFLEELGRYRSGWLHCDPAIAGLPVVGVFSVEDTEASLLLLSQILPVRVRRRSRFWITVEPLSG
ncbi:MAG: FecR domain-containing protein [Kerstersia sp.]